MCPLRLLGRIVLLLALFLGVGCWTAHALIAHAVAAGTPEYKVRLAGAMGGLFAGGGATMIAGLALLLEKPRPKARRAAEAVPERSES